MHTVLLSLLCVNSDIISDSIQFYLYDGFQVDDELDIICSGTRLTAAQCI